MVLPVLSKIKRSSRLSLLTSMVENCAALIPPIQGDDVVVQLHYKSRVVAIVRELVHFEEIEAKDSEENLTKIGFLTPDFMRIYRKHAIVLILILAAIITPPDVTSQILVLLPLITLYEISIRISARVIKNREKNTE